MSLEPPDAAAGGDAPKKMRITYTREFLLSVGESDACKELPPGFDASILSELQDASAGVLERSRGHYGVPLGRGDGSGGYNRGGGVGGRWETRSSASSDRDGDSAERESFPSDRRPGNQYRRNWQSTEHDGLLGSGAFPRPSGYVGPLASKDRGSGYQLNRTSERYQPPRPYKAVPFSRKDIDSINDETFGSLECSDEDRAEEERKRRASFELMRKEQHKALQEKKSAPHSQKGNLGDDITALLQNSAEKTGTVKKSGKPDDSEVSCISQEAVTKAPSVLPAPTSRPIVPPGFSNPLVEKKLHRQSSNTSIDSEARTATSEENFPIAVHLGGLVDQSATNSSARKSEDRAVSDSVASLGQNYAIPSLPGEAITSVEYASSIPKVNENWEEDVVDKYSIKKEGKSKTVNSVRQDNSISILEKFFGNALSKSSVTSPKDVETHHSKPDEDGMMSSVSESSKFAHWFLDEDARPAEDLSSKGLLSMIVKNENSGPENVVPGPSVSSGTFETLSPRSPVKNFDPALNLLSFSSPAPAPAPTIGILQQYNGGDIPEPVPVVMTCEDLEQSMLAEVGGSSSSNQQNPAQKYRPVVDEPSAGLKPAVDDASQHLLSLLQKGANSKGSSLGLHMGSSDEPLSSDLSSMVDGRIAGTAPVNNTETVPTSGKSLTLEALFGTAFMNELHSMEAPVSVRGSAASGPNYESDMSSSQRLPFAEGDDSLFSSNPGEFRADEQILHFNRIQDGAAPNEPGTGVDYRNSAFQNSHRGSTGFDERGLEIQLPEEDNLFTVSDSLDARNPRLLPHVKSGRIEGLLPEKAIDDLSYKFQNVVPGDADRIPVLGPDVLGSFSHGHHNQLDSASHYHFLQGKQPAQAPNPMNTARPVFAPMDHSANRNRQAPFNMPEAIHHDPYHSFPPSMTPMQHALNAPSRPHLDPAAHHLMLEHMSMPGNFPPQFPPQGLPRGVPPSQPMHLLPGYRPEMSNVNSFHMHPRQPNYGEFGTAVPGPSGPDVGDNHPEVLERLMQLELRARSKQIRPAMAGPLPGFYGPELDMNFRYR